MGFSAQIGELGSEGVGEWGTEEMQPGVHSLTPSLPHSTIKCRRTGFTLIEVLVAMIILAIGITGAMRVVGMSSLASAQSRDTMLAATLARQTLNELTSSSTLATGTDSGTYNTDYPGYHWESAVQESPEATTGLLDVTVTVYWPNGKEESKLSVTTSALDPATQTTTTDTAGSNSAAGISSTPGGL